LSKNLIYCKFRLRHVDVGIRKEDRWADATAEKQKSKLAGKVIRPLSQQTGELVGRLVSRKALNKWDSMWHFGGQAI